MDQLSPPTPASLPPGDDGRHPSLAGIVAGSMQDARMRARADLVWYLRHADALARWPVLPEPWAQRVEAERLAQPGMVGRRVGVSWAPTVAGR